jgi:hypothetical protein
MVVTTTELLLNVSPEDLNAESVLACSVEIFQDKLYLATLEQNLENTQKILRIRRFNQGINPWDLVYKFLWEEEVTSEQADSSAEDDQTSTDEDDQTSDDSAAAQVYENPYRCEFLILEDNATPVSILTLRVVSALNSYLVQSTDGNLFEISALKDFDLPPFASLQQHLNFENKLYAIFADSSEIESDFGKDIPHLYTGSNSVVGELQKISDSLFGDVSNQGIAAIAVSKGYFYAATSNAIKGFQVWRTKGDPGQADAWEPVITNGANRYSLNPVVFAIAEFRGDLYFACGVPVDKDQKVNTLYSGGFEIIRCYADNDWDLIVGTPRFTGSGLRVPLTALGPGFDDISKQVVDGLISHNDLLYLVTQGREGFQLWTTADGENWSPISQPELASAFQVKVEAALSASGGLFMLIKTTEPNGEQSLQIWHLD